ncbi:MAG: hypothetical protein M1836_005072 [Candelina mexicana]|nr:MAG: hypothetical protein M1836_005072 [Candelina mexicana]
MKLFPVDGLPSPPSATQAFQPVSTPEAHIISNSKSHLHFHFLLLPPEIRNQIYRYLVHVRDQKLIIRDVLQHAWNPELKRSTYMLEYDQETKGRRCSFTYLTTYRCSNCDWDKRRWVDNHLPKPGPRRRGDPPVEEYEWEEPPHLNIVLANRQLHREAQSVFHEQQFCLDMSARGALAFLRDRSATAISQIQRLGIRYNGVDVYSNGEYLKRTDKTSWADLCYFFRENMRLKELHLYLGCSVWGDDSVVQRTAHPVINGR